MRSYAIFFLLRKCFKTLKTDSINLFLLLIFILLAKNILFTGKWFIFMNDYINRTNLMTGVSSKCISIALVKNTHYNFQDFLCLYFRFLVSEYMLSNVLWHFHLTIPDLFLSVLIFDLLMPSLSLPIITTLSTFAYSLH